MVAETASDAEDTVTLPQKRKLQRIPTFRQLPSERFPWSAHLPVLKNLVLRSKFGEQAIDTDVVEEGLRTQSASLNLGFFVETGLAQKEKRKYRPSPECIQYVRLQNIDERKAKLVLRSVVEKTWFAQVVRQTLELHGTTTEDILVKELAVDVGVVEIAPKKRAFEVLLEYLRYTEIVAQDGDAYRLLVPGGSSPVTQRPSAAEPVPQSSESAGEPALSYSPPNSRADWVHRNWPGKYDLWVSPDEAALQLLEKVIHELKEALRLTESKS